MFDIGLSIARPSAFWLLITLPIFAWLGVRFGVRRRAMPRAALWLRLVVALLFVVTLSEPLLTSGGGTTNTVFLLDRSQSLEPGTADTVNTWVNDALSEAGSSDRAAVINFGASPDLAASAAGADSLDASWEDPEFDPQTQAYTDIGSAIALGRALPLGGNRRLVLASDGAENLGDAMDQAGQAAEDGIPIDVLMLPGVGENDLRVQSATAPSSTWQGEPFAVLASVAAGSESAGTVELWIDGVHKETQNVTHAVGMASYRFQVSDLGPGFHAIEVRVTAASGDAFPENNMQPLAVVVREKPNVLLIVPEGMDAGLLAGALERRGAIVTINEPASVPFSKAELGQYDAFVLNNVAATEMTRDQHLGLQEAVRSLGRGLIVVGGVNSYGPGQYAGTPLEETLPVTVKVTDGRQREKVAVLFIMDKSGSMTYDPLNSTSKIEMAKEAVRIAARSLSDGDTVGILVFSDGQEWILKMTVIDGEITREQIDAAVAQITAEGGTEIYPALSVGYNEILGVEADVRHIVLLTDGKSRTGTRDAYARLIESGRADNVTLSTIAIGNDADIDLMQYLATQGGGRYHFTNRSEDIPKLTLEEAQSAGSQAVIRGDFASIQTNPSPILLTIAPEELPRLDGYDYAEAKPNAQVILTSDRDDPVLAKWQYGLGRVIAWTSDDGSDLASRWSSWPRFDEFWGSMLAWALPDPERRPMQVNMSRDGTDVVLQVEAVGEGNDYVDLSSTTASITSPSGVVEENRSLHQTGPGRYEVRVSAPEAGAYKVELNQSTDGSIPPELAGFAVPPSPELQPDPDAAQLLSAIAARSGGRTLSMEDAAAAFSGGGLSGEPIREFEPIWWLPLSLGLLALLAEIAVRMGVLQWLRRRT
jgi:Ca-activated chloride channel family protein